MCLFLIGVYVSDTIIPDSRERLLVYDVFIAAFCLSIFVGKIRTLFRYRLRIYTTKYWRTLREKRAILSARELLNLFGLFFLCLWLFRWFGGISVGLDPVESIHFLTYISAGMLALIIGQLLVDDKTILFLRRLDLTPGRTVVLLYVSAALLGAFSLIMPWSLQAEKSLSFVDAIFISVSSLSVTGLTPVNIAETFTLAGLTSILMMIQIGGLGIVAITAGLASIARSRISMASSLLGRENFDMPDLGELSRFVSRVLILAVVCEIIGAVWIYFTISEYTPNRLFHAIFHAISSFCNAGLSSFADSLNSEYVFVHAVWCSSILSVIGSFCFPIIFELVDWLWNKRRCISANGYLNIFMTILVALGGTISFFTVDYLTAQNRPDFWSHVGESLFYAIPARTAGFNLRPIAEFSQGAVLITLVLMLIGGSPLSTAGGIKTSTLGVIITSAISFMRGHSWIQFHNREIPITTLMKSISLVTLYMVISILAIITLISSEGLNPLNLTFEVVSAISTCGLSLGVTPYLSTFAKVILIILMLLGRLGIMTIIYVGAGKISEQRFRYPKDHFFAG